MIFPPVLDDSIVRSSSVEHVFNILNSYHPNIKWEITARGGRRDEPPVPFLDLELRPKKVILCRHS